MTTPTLPMLLPADDVDVADDADDADEVDAADDADVADDADDAASPSRRPFEWRRTFCCRLRRLLGSTRDAGTGDADVCDVRS